MYSFIVWWIIVILGLTSLILWYVDERSLGAAVSLIFLGALLNRFTLAVNGGSMPIGIDSDDARLLWFSDIFYIPSFFQFSFGRTDITVRSSEIGGYYSIGDFMIFFGVAGIVAIVAWRMVRKS